MEQLNILFTSVGRRSYLVHYFKDILKENGEIHVVNSSDISPAFQAADYSAVSPLIYDKNYIPFLKSYCKQNNIKAIIPLFDVDLPVLSRSKEEFAQIGVKVIVSAPYVTEICNDKWKTYQFLIDNGFNAPRTFLKFEDAMESISRSEISYPVMIKPRWGMGSIAVYEAENEEELKVFYDKTKRNILKTYLKYESEANINESVLIQEKLKGQEYGLDVINDLTGKNQTTICKLKYAMRSGETDCAITIDNDDLRKTGTKIGEIFQHIGNLDCDVFLVDGKPYVLEMNARFGGGYPFSHMAGVNLPHAIINWLQGKEVNRDVLKEKIGVMAQKDINLVCLNRISE